MISEYLRKLRIKNKLTIDDVANSIDITANHLRHIESGKYYSAKINSKLFRIYKVQTPTYQDLYEFTKSENKERLII